MRSYTSNPTSVWFLTNAHWAFQGLQNKPTPLLCYPETLTGTHLASCKNQYEVDSLIHMLMTDYMCMSVSGGTLRLEATESQGTQCWR